MKSLAWADKDLETWLHRSWPMGILRGIGRDVRRLQKGERPLAFRPLPDFGPQLGELKRGNLRVVYTTELPNTVGIICAFRKKSDKITAQQAAQIRRGLAGLRAGEGIVSDQLISKLVH
jgi:phage-related protein